MLLKVENVYFRYPGGIDVLRGASFFVNRGEVIAILGSNGSGKTTLLMVAAGLLNPSKGVVLLDNKPLKNQLPEARRRIGLVFQDPDDQLFNSTVYDEIAFTLRQILPFEEVDKKVVEVAERFRLSNLLNKPPYKLSIGEKRMVTLASILAYNPEVLLLDEPTANLSLKSVEEVEKVVVEAKDAGKAVVVASHDIEFVAKVANRVYILNNGLTLGGLDARSVLVNKSLLELADMKPPIVFQAIKLLKLKFEKEPLTLEELSKILKLE
ncbi:MAG: energy-coupling factor ABC transporter ATP-binding protein [Candidatus Bathyarchaeota archaeon]|nr:energy-coupling factor ABC transporter ATP-binding protein [Candidatus Bathyarchaeota archaeon]